MKSKDFQSVSITLDQKQTSNQGLVQGEDWSWCKHSSITRFRECQNLFGKEKTLTFSPSCKKRKK